MRNILDDPKKVPEHLRKKWDGMSKRKKQHDRGLENLTQNIKFIASVAGSGKTDLLIFTALMALPGGKGVEHPQKIIYFVRNRTAIRTFASTIEQEMKAMGHAGRVFIRHDGNRAEPPAEFSGVVVTTPYFGCYPAFVRNFQASVCLIDNATSLAFVSLQVRPRSPSEFQPYSG